MKTNNIDVTEFVHRGRKPRIFRREAQGNFYIRREIGGRALWKSLDSPIARIAIGNAHAWLDATQQAAADAKWERLDPVRSKTSWSSIGEILERYEARATGAVQIAAHSVKNNANCLRQLLRIATGTADPDGLRADVLTESTARTFIEKSRSSGRSESGIHSSLVQARTLTERRIICQRASNRFVSQFLPDRPKCAYELRKWAGSLVWSTQGAEAAQHFLGHRSMSTTERYYARFSSPRRSAR